MNKLKLFIENFLVYGLGGIISKLIPLIMVPIVTRLMPSSDFYGLSDLSDTVVSFASALAVMGMYDAMYRMFFEQDDEAYKKSVCSTALVFTLSTSFVVFVLLLIFKEQIAQFVFSDKKYAYIVYISAMATLVGATNNIISAPTRMQNKRKIFLVTNTLSPLISYAVSIPMLLAGYYAIALPLAAVISGVTMELTFAVLNHSWFDPKKIDVKLLKQLLGIAIPLLPNFLIYWVFNSCDKMMITNMVGIGAAGVYSVGAKLGHASQLIYTAFAGGWQYFAFSTMKDENQVESTSNIFEYLGVISFICTAFIFVLARSIYQLLFTGEYVSGCIISPYLFLAPLLQMLFQVACNQFLVVKKTWPNMLILSGGAVVNIVINYYLIPVLGIEGAAIATLMGYAVSDVVGILVLEKMKLMRIQPRFILASALMVCFIITWRTLTMDSVLLSTVLALLLSIVLILLYRRDISKLVKGVRGKENETA